MNNKTIGRRAGLFLLIMVAAGIPGVLFRGLSSDLLNDPTLITTLVESSTEMRVSILLSFVAGIFGLFFSVTAYRILSSHSKFAAVTFLGLWILQVAVALVGDVSHYVLLETAQHASEANLGVEEFLPFAALGIKGYVGAHFLSLLIFSGSFVFLHAHFLKFGLLPKWLAIWGVLATSLVFSATWFQVFDQSVSFHFYNQNGFFMLTFTGYMLVKGFKESD